MIEPEAHELVCTGCAQPKTRIGEDVTEELEYEPAVLRVNEYERPTYACRHCAAGVVQADLPARPIDKGRPGAVDHPDRSRLPLRSPLRPGCPSPGASFAYGHHGREYID